jgi:heat shock protein HslJ
MRTTLAPLAAALAAASLVLAGCAGAPQNLVGEPVADEFDGAWLLVSGTDSSGPIEPGDVSVTLEIDGPVASGTSGCNSYSGDFRVEAGGASLGPFASTEAACASESAMALEARYLRALAAVDTATADGDTLTLGHDDDELRFTRSDSEEQDDQMGAIIGEWQLTKGSDAEGAMVVGGVPVTLVIADDAVNGQGPCNGYGGDAQLDGTGIRIGALMSTKIACADDARTRLESRYLAALQAVTSSQLGSGDPATLTLTGPDATLQFTGVAKKSPN